MSAVAAGQAHWQGLAWQYQRVAASSWARRFIRFHGLRHPRALGGLDVEKFLTHLTTVQKVAPSTHRQALAAVLYLYRQVLDMELPWMESIGRPRPHTHVPVVLSRDEVARMLAAIDPEFHVIVSILYGAGLRLGECLGLRVKDLDFDRGVIVVRDGKGGKDRIVMLPTPAREALRGQLRHARSLWAHDRANALPGVEMPRALANKYPRAGESWAWFWVFPAASLSADPRSGIRLRFHRYGQTVSRALSGLPKLSADPTSDSIRSRILSLFHDTLREPNMTYSAGLALGGSNIKLDPNGDASVSGKVNIVPAEAVAKGDLRVLTPEQLSRVKDKMQSIVTQNLPGTTAEIRFVDKYPPMAPTPGNLALMTEWNDVSRALAAPAVQARDPMAGGAGDASFVAQFASVLDSLGPFGTGLHAPGETVDLARLPLQSKRAALLIYGLSH